MKLAVASALVALTAAAAPPAHSYFNAGDAPKCWLHNGRTIVHFDSNIHPSFHCSHNAANTKCACEFEHPTHAKGACKSFAHNDGTVHSIGGDCSDAGRNVCESQSPCKNGAACTNSANGKDYTCSCPTGWTGKNCAQSVDDCAGSPCKNGATCADGHNSFTCTCAYGWKGATCTTKKACTTNCNNGSVRGNQIDGCSCICSKGWEGSTCTKRSIASSCQAIKDSNPGARSGSYDILLAGHKGKFYCDLSGSVAWMRLNFMDSSRRARPADVNGTPVTRAFVQALYSKAKVAGWSDSASTMHRDQSWKLMNSGGGFGLSAKRHAVGTVDSRGYYWRSSSLDTMTAFTNVLNGKTPTGTSSYMNYEGGYLQYSGKLSTYGSWRDMYQGCGWSRHYRLGESIGFRTGGTRSHNGEYIHTSCNGYRYHHPPRGHIKGRNSITTRPAQGGYPRYAWLATSM